MEGNTSSEESAFKSSGGQTGSRRLTKEPGSGLQRPPRFAADDFVAAQNCATDDMSVCADNDKFADLCIAIDPALNPRFAFGSRIASDPVGPQVGKDEFDAGSSSRRQ